MKHGQENSWKTSSKGHETEDKENVFNIHVIRRRREGMGRNKI